MLASSVPAHVEVRDDLGWCEVLVDVREQPTSPVSTTIPEAAGTITGHGHTLHTAIDDEITYAWWALADGRTAAIVSQFPSAADLTATKPPVRLFDVMPSIHHLLVDREALRQISRVEAVALRHLPYLTDLLNDPGRLLRPIRGVADSEPQAAYRIAYAALGVEVEDIPSVLRDTTILEPIEWGQPPRKALPYGLAYRFPRSLDWAGVRAGTMWLAAGFALDDIPEWIHVAHRYGMSGFQFRSDLPSLEDIESVEPFKRAGFTPDEAARFVVASTPDWAPFPRPSVTALTRYRDAGVPANLLAWLIADFPAGGTAEELEGHIDGWLAAVPSNRAGLYIAAGIGQTEAAILESSPEPPDRAALVMLAGLGSAARLPDPALHPIPMG